MNSVSEMLNYKGKTVLVTGGAKGMGVGIVRRFAQAGANVVFTFHSHGDQAEPLARELREYGVQAEYIEMDQGNVEACRAAVRFAQKITGRLDVLINNSGLHGNTATMELDQDIWDTMLAVNLRGAFFCSQEAALIMQQQAQGGSIISISSINSMNPLDNACHYGAAKAGVNHFTRSLAKELGPSGIRVNAIAPGLIEVDGMDAWVPGWRQRFIDRSPLHKAGTKEDIANICLFLASPMAAWITGQTIIADGGVMLAPWY